jgi:hypothetical protein
VSGALTALCVLIGVAVVVAYCAWIVRQIYKRFR